METNYVQYISARRERLRSERLLESLRNHALSRQHKIIAELCLLAGLPAQEQLSPTEQVHLLADQLREHRRSGWQALVSEFWSLERGLN